MAHRLVEVYSEGQAVEIRLADGQWWAGRVVGRDHPGLWIQTGDGTCWFVTNGANIRPAPTESDSQAVALFDELLDPAH